MSELLAAELPQRQASSHPQDLLARLYREIGISAVAAALDVMATPVAAKTIEPLDERDLPAILRSEDIAA